VFQPDVGYCPAGQNGELPERSKSAGTGVVVGAACRSFRCMRILSELLAGFDNRITWFYFAWSLARAMTTFA